MRDIFARAVNMVRREALSGTFVALAAALCACQPRPNGAHDPAPGNAQVSSAAPSPRADRPFTEGESCSRSDDCPASARCVEHHCVLSTRSLRGEVLVERGARALALGRFDEATAAYQQAETAYRDRSIPIPSSVWCGLASSYVAQLDRGSAGQDLREQAARSAARCLGAAPPASPASEGVLAQLASLVDRGLEVGALDRDDSARLMSGQDRSPGMRGMTITVVFSGAADQGSRGMFKTLVEGEAVRQEITRCFLRWYEEHRTASDEGIVRVTYARAMDEYDTLTAARLTVTAPDVDPALATPAQGRAAHWVACSAAAIRAASVAQRWPARAERWTETVSIRIATQ
jgi:hypothetical protein